MSLIAAKPVKSCDGGVFGAFYLLLKKEQNASNRACLAALWPLARKSGASLAGSTIQRPKPPRQSQPSPCPTPCPAGVAPPASPKRPRKHRPFATSLIAAKPVKPCDGGVFGLLNWPSKKSETHPRPDDRASSQAAPDFSGRHAFRCFQSRFQARLQAAFPAAPAWRSAAAISLLV